jgi:hypothetical protein
MSSAIEGFHPFKIVNWVEIPMGCSLYLALVRRIRLRSGKELAKNYQRLMALPPE